MQQLKQSFTGRSIFYQSLKEWDVKGMRDTDLRQSQYQLLNLINENSRVLDIGCNIGMFGFYLRNYIDSYYGIDLDKKAIKIANEFKKNYKVDNCNFENRQYDNDFILQNSHKYDLILNLQMLHWIDSNFNSVLVEQFMMLDDNGILVIESNNMKDMHKDFHDNDEVANENGFEIIGKGFAHSGNISKRGFYVLRKNAELLID